MPFIAPATSLEEAFLGNRERLQRFLRARGAGEGAEDLLQDLWLRFAAAPDPAAACGLAYMMRAADRLMIAAIARPGRRATAISHGPAPSRALPTTSPPPRPPSARCFM
ncbi:MAG: hypothetical protein O9293_08430 [Porphyrobacter sp.]|nr:hypothetical protein [Porphyrobacter sp.]